MQLLVTYCLCPLRSHSHRLEALFFRYAFFNSILWSIGRGLHAASQDPWQDPWRPEAPLPESNESKLVEDAQTGQGVLVPPAANDDKEKSE